MTALAPGCVCKPTGSSQNLYSPLHGGAGRWSIIHTCHVAPHWSSLSVALKDISLLAWGREGRWQKDEKQKTKKSNGHQFPLKLCFLLWRRIGTDGFIKSLLWRWLKTMEDFPLILMNFSLVLEDWTSIRRPPAWVFSMIKLFLWGGERLLWIQMSLYIP